MRLMQTMNFKKLELNDIEKIRPFLNYTQSAACDLTIGGLFLWREYYKVEYCIEDNTLYTRLFVKEDDKFYYHMPLGADVNAAIKKLTAEILASEESITFITIAPGLIRFFDEYQGKREVIPTPEIYDYLYDAIEIKELAGSKFSKQRNHISRFKKDNPDWEYLNISDVSKEELIDFFTKVYLPQVVDPRDSQVEENKRVLELLNNQSLYNFCGGVLKAGGRIIGFTFGEKLHNVLFDQIEKADRNFSGAYQMLFHEFALHEADDSIDIINREDDAGDPGLRKAKLAYHPIRMEEKNKILITA